MNKYTNWKNPNERAKKISNSRKGLKMSDEARSNMSRARLEGLKNGTIKTWATGKHFIHAGSFKKGHKMFLGKHHSEETKEKLSLIKLRNRNRLEHVISEETKQKLCNGDKRKKISEENKIIMSLLQKGKKNVKAGETKKKLYADGKLVIWNKGLTKETDERVNLISKKRTGLKRSEKTIKKFILSRRGKPNSEEQKKKQSESMIKYFKDHPEEKIRMKILRKNIILPKIDSKIEIKIQNFLKELKIEFYTHYWMNIEHGYQCDIFIPSSKTIIECDGDYWHGHQKLESVWKDKKYVLEQKERDIIRTKELESKGFKVVRLWESEIKSMDLDKFKERL